MVDRLTSDLTIEQLQRIIANHESGVQLTSVAMYRQLLATMQREAKLREALEHLADYKGILGDSYVRTYCLEKLAQYRAATGKSEGE